MGWSNPVKRALRPLRAIYRKREPPRLTWIRLTRLAGAVEAGIVFALVRVGLWTIPFHWMLATVEFICNRRPRTVSLNIEKRVSAVVRRFGRRSPANGRCLAEALTARILLSRQGIEARLRIGVCRGIGGGIRAHAWLQDANGDVLIGGPASVVSEFVVLEDTMKENESLD